ncbi:MAG TPA: NAD(P)H-dependent oxidoreductase [Candidatus Saccharimonadales bacterium]|nr:NAD(P)H-dependent oxidoreductase [Candidatus Saccharimonadales bacterium]
MDLYLPVLAGTTRQQRKSIHAARLVYEIGKTIEGVKTELVDPMDYSFSGDGNDPEGKDPKYTAITEKADGFFIVTPEYNHSYPGSLKRMLDSELSNYIHKPVAFGGVSSTGWGGVRAIEALVTTVREMGLAVTFTDVQFPFVQNLFDNDGKLLDDNYVRRVQRSWTELIWMAKALKAARESS